MSDLGPLPDHIGRYKIARELGRGTMGIVYEARDTALDRMVAIKTIDPGLGEGFGGREAFERRFFEEARIAARVSHPGIVVCHDVGKDPETGTLFIVLEHLEGVTLAERVRGGEPMPWREALAVMVKVARAIDHAHKYGVVHRDLKPANVIVLPSGEAKVLDFGIAKVETARLKLTMAGQSLGSPLYMSPEQALGEDARAPTDIFSMGSVLCTLLLGRPHYAAANIPDMLARILREDPPAVSPLVPGVPVEIDDVLRRAMARRPEERYGHASLLAEDLEDILASRPPRHARSAAASDADALVAELDERPTGDPPPLRFDPLDDIEALVASPRAAAPAVPVAPVAPARKALERGIVVAAIVATLAVLAGGGLSAYALLLWHRHTGAAEPAAVREEAAPASGAQLHVVVEHGLKAGSLRLWIDDALAFETRLVSRKTKKLVVLSGREGHAEETLPVEAGHHRVRVEVDWEDNRRSETVSGTFKGGSTRTLEVSVGGLGKSLSLDWK